MLTSIILSLTATLTPVENASTPDFIDASKLDTQVVLEDRRRSKRKLIISESLEDRRRSKRKLSFEDSVENSYELVLEDRRRSKRKL